MQLPAAIRLCGATALVLGILFESVLLVQDLLADSKGTVLYSSFPDSWQQFPKTVWLWEDAKSEPERKEYYEFVHQQWEKLNPEFEVRKMNMSQAKREYPDLYNVFARMPTKPYQQAQLVSLMFLADHGGVWVDRTMMPVKPLRSWLPHDVDAAGTFLFKLRDRIPSFEPGFEGLRLQPKVGAMWFMAAFPKQKILKLWRDASILRWQADSSFTKTEEISFTLSALLAETPSLANFWHTIPFRGTEEAHSCIEGCANLFTEQTSGLENFLVLKCPWKCLMPQIPPSFIESYTQHVNQWMQLKL